MNQTLIPRTHERRNTIECRRGVYVNTYSERKSPLEKPSYNLICCYYMQLCFATLRTCIYTCSITHQQQTEGNLTHELNSIILIENINIFKE